MADIIDFPGNKNEKVKQEPASLVERVNNFDQLEEVIDEIGPVRGSQDVYSPDQLIDLIKKVRVGELDINYVTSTHGLRGKVSELLQSDSASPEDIQRKNYEEWYQKSVEKPFKEMSAQPDIKSLVSTIVSKYVKTPASISYDGGLQIFEFEDLMRKAPDVESFKKLFFDYMLKEEQYLKQLPDDVDNISDNTRLYERKKLEKSLLEQGLLDRTIETLYQ